MDLDLAKTSGNELTSCSVMRPRYFDPFPYVILAAILVYADQLPIWHNLG